MSIRAIDEHDGGAHSETVATRGFAWLPTVCVMIACGSQGTDPNAVTNADGGTANNPPPTAYTDPFAGAAPYVSTKAKGDTSHNAGEACGKQGCHGKGGEGPAFLIGGTVYTDYAGTTPAAGVEIRVVDTSNNAVSTYSQSNGNFYISSGSTNVTLPAVVGARDATTTRPMITQLTGTMGTCAQAGCHVGADAGGYYPIHVP